METEFKVVHSDCLDVLKEIESDTIDLIYLDPPFFTQKVQKLKTRDRTKEYSYKDLWGCHKEYTKFLFERILELHRVLADHGSIFFHCDKNASYIARALLDDIFGGDKFRSEIIWYYKRWSNAKKGLLSAHQNILFYSKTDNFTFHPVFVKYSETTNVDQILQLRQRDEHGKAVYARNANGDVVFGNGKKGVPLSDVWEIPYLNPKAKERVGYPTQKPIILLERIISLCSNLGDMLLDPFCGSGTTLVAAKLLGRRGIGIDASADAIKLTKQRLANPIRSESPLLQKGRDSYRNADEESLAILTGVDCVPVHRNNGIDALFRRNVLGGPVPIRVQRPRESLAETINYLYKAGRTKHARLMILVMTQDNCDLGLNVTIPKEIVIVDATSKNIKTAIERVAEQEPSEATERV